MMGVIYILFYFLLSQQLVKSQVTVDDINEIREELLTAFDASGRFRDLLSTTVRLVFHDCSGVGNDGVNSGCNGCIDFSNPAHAGLVEGAVIALDELYIVWSDIMSRTDFWALAGTIAIEYAQELDEGNTGDSLPSIPYYFGRVDCGTSAQTTITKEFIGPFTSWTQIATWFNDNIAFNDRQSVALIGAHTLGRAHTRYTGFSNLPWVVDEGDILDNEFYIDLLDDTWIIQTSSRGQWEWKTSLENALMFTSDMALKFDIEPYLNTETGQVNCPSDGCDASPVIDIVREYADSNQVWLDDFAEVWRLLITMGYDVDNDLVIVGDVNAANDDNDGNDQRQKPNKRNISF